MIPLPTLIPVPQRIELRTGSFRLTPETGLTLEPQCDGLRGVAEMFVAWVRRGSDLPLAIRSPAEPEKGMICLMVQGNLDSLGEEGYLLDVSEDSLVVRASEVPGILYGLQTVRQLLPAALEESSPERGGGEWAIPAMRIEDRPRFGWRGMLLDVSRHFMSKETVKRTIDLLVLHKMNRFHWHLTDDQGWRLAIDRYPRLTSIGGWRREADGRIYGGFYTKDDIREIVEYAARRQVTIVPEIEMPGHSVASLASYPEHSCSGGPFEVESRWGIFDDVYCAGNDQTFAFLETILDEVIDLFPGRYIHIGGDECPKERWRSCPRCQERIADEGLSGVDELQSWFIRRIAQYLEGRGKRVIGWDEIIEGELVPGMIVQSWRGFDGAVAAARLGNDAIVSPTSHAYFDYDVATTNLEKVYGFEPVPDTLTWVEKTHILGGECNLWTERISEERLDSMLFPRVLAMAERLWSPCGNEDWEGFRRRVGAYYPRLEALGLKYGKECEDG